uniref:Uncharacterized protein n=1 Tax=Kalanchoe fedtschenkoi TaxID=63787 RepID=A0A7N0UFQ1_KALFE
MKKQHLEDLKSEDIVIDPLCSAISPTKLDNQEMLDPAETVTHCSSEECESLNDERHGQEESSSDRSCFDNQKSVASGNPNGEPVKEYSTCPENQFEKYDSLRNENPGDREHYWQDPASRKGCSDNQSYVGSEEEHGVEDRSSLGNEDCISSPELSANGS